MKFDNSTTFEQFLKLCEMDYSLTIDEIYTNYLNDLELANEEAKQEQVLPKNATTYEIMYANLTKNEPDSFYLKPYDFIRKKASFYKDVASRNEYLQNVIFETEKYKNDDGLLGFEESEILLKKIIMDYQKSYHPPLYEYKDLIEKSLKEHFEKRKGIYNRYYKFPSMKNLWDIDLLESCLAAKLSIIDDIAERINDFEIVKLCKSLMIDGLTTETNPLPKKLKWKGTPSQFGFIFQELCQKGYIETPDISKKKLAALLFGMFDFNSTIGTIENEIGMNNSLTPDKQKKYKIPPQDEV
jgi:hypothetical protein